MTTIIVSIFLAIGLLSFALAIFVFWMSSPTKGQAINQLANRRALLVIDLQTVFFGAKNEKKFPYKEKDHLLSAVNQLIAKFSERGDEVLYIAQVNPSDLAVHLGMKFLAKDNPETHYDPRVKVVNKNIFYKKKGDAFSVKALDNYLRAKQVRDVYLVGIDGLGCVWRTAQGAVNRKYRAYAVREAIGIKDGDWQTAADNYNKDHIMISHLAEALK